MSKVWSFAALIVGKGLAHEVPGELAAAPSA